MEPRWNDIDRETKELIEKPVPLSTTKPIWTDLGGFRVERPATIA
jgi:hypothetical protein